MPDLNLLDAITGILFGFFSLFPHFQGQFRTADPIRKTVIVFNQAGPGKLAARNQVLQDYKIRLSPGRIDTGGQASRTSADDYQIIHFIVLILLNRNNLLKLIETLQG